MTMTIIYVTCTDVEVHDDHLRILLDCGHSYETVPHYNDMSIEDYYVLVAQMIDHQQRCSDCEAAQAEIERQKL